MQIILQGCAGEEESELRGELDKGVITVRGTVLEHVTLVVDADVELETLKEIAVHLVTRCQLVSGYKNVPTAVFEKSVANHRSVFLGSIVRLNLQIRAEVCKFTKPVLYRDN